MSTEELLDYDDLGDALVWSVATTYRGVCLAAWLFRALVRSAP